ncbi:MAG: HNH endonuclease [Limnochordia bacterium]|jgi:predicted HNH restriction endonuclease|nr:HNH endonuclease [Limnochordia bacterium]MDD2629721.1 HNH endonuclease [Limnochordia bacterium]MDD4517425.1 HNH endonuclease [Limnochordia bacterium]
MLTKDVLFLGLPIGFETDAREVADLSGENQVKGIHKLSDENGELEAVVLLCTINGEYYPNEWIEPRKILKYYFFGRKHEGKKRFSPDYQDNRAVLASRGNYPLFVFTRERAGHKFVYQGEYELIDASTDLDGAMYFLLRASGMVEGVSLGAIAIEDNENFPEGKVQERLHKYRERNPNLVTVAKNSFLKRHGRLYCEACGFDFAKAYGDRGEGCIEVHHKTPLSELESGHTTTSIEDVLLVCANCHRIIHRIRPWLTTEQIYTLAQNRNT